jgi:hypothetical protein
LAPGILGLKKGPHIRCGNILLILILIGIAATHAANRQYDGKNADIDADELVAISAIFPVGFEA